MGQGTDREYLLSQQYHDSTRLAARARFHALFGTNTYGWFPWFFDHLHLPAHARILELGSGPGWLWSANEARIPAGWDVTLSDFSSGMVAEAQRRLGASSHPYTFAEVDAQAIPYADGAFDGVIADHMLYHVPDRPKAFAEIRRVLKSGGRFYASTLGIGHLQELWALFPHSTYDPQRSFPFNLQNGAEQIAPFFAHVELHRYEDAFVATSAEPLVDYIFSLSPRAAAAGEEARAALVRRIQARIEANGPLHITSDMGFFEAW